MKKLVISKNHLVSNDWIRKDNTKNAEVNGNIRRKSKELHLIALFLVFRDFAIGVEGITFSVPFVFCLNRSWRGE